MDKFPLAAEMTEEEAKGANELSLCLRIPFEPKPVIGLKSSVPSFLLKPLLRFSCFFSTVLWSASRLPCRPETLVS